MSGSQVNDPLRQADVMDAALAMPGPVILEAVVDPNEPLLPAAVPETYARNIKKALKAGIARVEELRAALARTLTCAMMETCGD